jgi:hypothetical protein
LDSQGMATITDLKPTTKTDVERKEKPEPNLPEKYRKESLKAKASIGKFFLSALASRLFFLALLPICLGVTMKALFNEVSPQVAN